MRSLQVSKYMVLIAPLTLAACSGDQPATADQATSAANTAAPAIQQTATAATAAAPGAAQMPAGHPPVQAQASGAMPINTPNVGRVVSVAQAGPYTYVEVDQSGRRIWLAGSRTENLARGALVRWGEAAVMRNFKSKALDRTFDQVLFVAGIQPVNAGQPQQAASSPQPAANTGKVLAVMNASGYSYIEVESQGGRKWLAAPQSTVKVDDTVAWNGGATMHNFNSKSLNRVFGEIDFVDAVTVK